MVRKAKKYVPTMPKLGWQDHLLYSVAEGVTFFGSLAVLFLLSWMQDRYAFSYEEVAAANSGPGNMNMIFMVMWLLLLFVLIVFTHISRFPVFGNKNVKYGPPGYPRVYPLLMKNKPKHWVSQLEITKKKREHKYIAIGLVSTFLFSLFMLGLSVYGREVLCYNGTVQVYSCWNQQKEDYKFSEIAKVTLDTKQSGGSRTTPKWYVQMKIQLQDGKTYSYYHTAFRGDTKQQLQELMTVKENYRDLLVIGNLQNLKDVAEDHGFSTEEQMLLYQLFEVG